MSDKYFTEAQRKILPVFLHDDVFTKYAAKLAQEIYDEAQALKPENQRSSEGKTALFRELAKELGAEKALKEVMEVADIEIRATTWSCKNGSGKMFLRVSAVAPGGRFFVKMSESIDCHDMTFAVKANDIGEG